MRFMFAALLIVLLSVVCFPAPAMAQCEGGSCRVGALAPVRIFRVVRERERKPLRNAGRWLIRR